MKKQVLDLKLPKNIKFEFPKGSETEIEIQPYLNLSEQISLIESYVRHYFDSEINLVKSSKYDYINAELQLALGVVDTVTDIQVVGEDGSLLLSENDLKISGLWDEVKAHIKNYTDFRETLDRVVTDIKELQALEKSVGNVLDQFVVNVPSIIQGLLANLEKLIRTDISPESIREIQKLTKGLSKELSSPAISGLIKESEQEQKNNVAAKRTRKPSTTA